MAEPQAERTEPATPRRREEARRRGQVAQSRDVGGVVVLAAALLALGSFLGAGLAGRVAALAQASWGGAGTPPDSLADFQALLWVHVGGAGLALLPLLAALAAAGAAAQFVQVGPLFSWQALQPRADRLDPIQGMKRLLHYDRLFDLARAVLKIAAAGALAFALLRADLPRLLGLLGASPAEGALATGDLARRVALALLLALGALAALDLVYQRWRHEQRLRMTRQEVREEARQREGDPLVRGRFRARQRELSRLRMIAAVADADVVVTNPTHLAVALRYDRRAMAAPRVLAKGRNQVALRIRLAAERHRVPIVENAPLARLLHRTTRIGHEIPENLFQAVAEVLAYVYRLDPRRAVAWGASR
jgi:flagellar biosynthetic protein FlhB